MSQNFHLLGIDCAAQAKNFSVAKGMLIKGELLLQEIQSEFESLAEIRTSLQLAVVSAIQHRQPCILAFDAPLGWPKPLSESLESHQAGEKLNFDSNQLFSRETDRFVHQKLGKKPLEVGAERIARAAVTSLKLIEDLRQSTGQALPLLWQPEAISQSGLFECYPAATLRTRGLSDRGYKGKEPRHQQAREKLIQALSKEWQLSFAEQELSQSDHALDAALSLLTAADFARDQVHQPADLALAQQEGWIWVASLTLDEHS